MARPDRLVAPALGALWTNRSRLQYAWDVLRHAVCNDCSLGASGLSDGTLAGSHLCPRRLRRLPRVTADAFDAERVADVSTLPRTREALLALGRIPTPLIRRAGARGFSPIGWTDATHLLHARLRDSRSDAAWSLQIDPTDVDLETLFQLRRVAGTLERRAREEAGLPPLIDLQVSEEERRLRHEARARLGQWGSTSTLAALDTGDPVAVVARGKHPLLAETVAALRKRGVLAVLAEDGWPEDVRQTLVYGQPGVFAALSLGVALGTTPTAPEQLERLTAVWVVGATRGAAPSAPFRAHQAAFLDAAMLEPAAEVVLLLPSELPVEHVGGSTFLADDRTLRFSPRVRGHGIPGAAAGWDIAVRVLAHGDADAAAELAAHDSSELRQALAQADPRFAGLLDLGAPEDTAALA